MQFPIQACGTGFPTLVVWGSSRLFIAVSKRPTDEHEAGPGYHPDAGAAYLRSWMRVGSMPATLRTA